MLFVAFFLDHDRDSEGIAMKDQRVAKFSVLIFFPCLLSSSSSDDDFLFLVPCSLCFSLSFSPALTFSGLAHCTLSSFSISVPHAPHRALSWRAFGGHSRVNL